MNHVDLDDLADLVLDPDATPDSVRAHVESCAECADRLDALLDVRRLAVGEPLVAPPDRVRDQVLAQVRGDPTHRRRARPRSTCPTDRATSSPRAVAASPSGRPASPPASPSSPASASAG